MRRRRATLERSIAQPNPNSQPVPPGRGGGGGSGDSEQDEEKLQISRKVAKALGVREDGKTAIESDTLKQVQSLSEQAGIAFVRAREFLETARMYVEDRVKRDAAIFVATVEYIRQRTILDSRRVLAAAADLTAPIALLAGKRLVYAC